MAASQPATSSSVVSLIPRLHMHINMAFDQCRFADCLAKYEAIWNVKAKDHGNKERRKAQIQALADECGISGECPCLLVLTNCNPSTACPPNTALYPTRLLASRTRSWRPYGIARSLRFFADYSVMHARYRAFRSICNSSTHRFVPSSPASSLSPVLYSTTETASFPP